MKPLRWIIGIILVALSLWALIDFQSLGRLFMFMSPDRSVTGLMMLLLRLLLGNLGLVGLLLVFFKQFKSRASQINVLITQIESRRFLVWGMSVALLLRLIVILFFPHEIWGDYASYDDLAPLINVI